VLDGRDAAVFAAGHLAGSASRPLAAALATAGQDLPAVVAASLPSIFLPPRHEPLAVVLESAGLATTVADLLATRRRAEVIAVVLAPGDVAALPETVCEAGASSRVLWRPPDFLARWAHLLPPPAAGPVLDLACGSGRAAVWLAQRGHHVTGIDHLPAALDLARRLATSAGVPVELRNADLRRPAAWPPGPWAAALCFRYLQRDLLRALPDLLAPGGVVMVQTFRHTSDFVGPPRPHHRLAPGELLTLLPRSRFTTLVHTEDVDGDGRPAAGIVASVRPGSSA